MRGWLNKPILDVRQSLILGGFKRQKLRLVEKMFVAQSKI